MGEGEGEGERDEKRGAGTHHWESELHVALATAHPHVPKQDVRDGDVAIRGCSGCYCKGSDSTRGREGDNPSAGDP